MALWEATRATSMFITSSYGAVQATVGSGSSYDVVSSAPDTTTCMSFCTGSVSAGTGQLIWKQWQSPATTPSSYYTVYLSIACRSMGTQYYTFEYSVDSGANWNTLISSVGGTNMSQTTITSSLAYNISVSSLWIRMNTTNTHRRSRSQIWDLTLAGSYDQMYNNYIGDTVGLTDTAVRSYWGLAQTYSATIADNLGITDGLFRSKGMFRSISDG